MNGTIRRAATVLATLAGVTTPLAAHPGHEGAIGPLHHLAGPETLLILVAAGLLAAALRRRRASHP